MGVLKETGFYDGEKLFQTYMSWGKAASHRRLREWCREVGMVNPATGEASHMGAYWAMWRWAFYNLHEAFPYYQDAMNQYGKFPTLEDFAREIYNRSKSRPEIVSKKKALAFAVEHSITE